MVEKRCACTFCGGWAGCELVLHVEGEKVVRVSVDPGVGMGNAWSGSRCERGWLDDDGKPVLEYHYGPFRLNYPLKRVGGRGEGRWERISWERGLDEVAGKLRELKEKYGAESLAICKGTLHYSDYQWPSVRFACLFGTPNYIGNEQVCYGPEVVSGELSFGWATGKVLTKVLPKLIVCGGFDPDQSNCNLMYMIKQAKKAGAKLIVIDPRMTETARNADVWLQIRPGTDCALLLAWVHVIVKERLFDENFVRNWSNAPFLVKVDDKEPAKMRLLRGSDVDPNGISDEFVVWNVRGNAISIWDPEKECYKPEETEPALEGAYEVKLVDGETAYCKTVWQLLKERVEPYSPKWAESITWIDAYKIVETARLYATIRPACFFAGHVYESFAPGSCDTFRLRNILVAICNHLEEGGEMLSGPYDPKKVVHEFELEAYHNMLEVQKRKQIGADRFRIFGFPGYDLKTRYQKRVWGVGSKFASSCQAHAPMVFRAILTGKPYPIKAMIVCGSNPIQKYPNAKLVYEALKKLELLVVLDFVETPTAALADYVFPMTDGLERPAFHTWTMSPVIRLGKRALKPLFERKDDYDFWRGLGIRLGQETHWPWKTLEECYDYRVRNSGYGSFEEMATKKPVDIAPMETRKFATPSRKVEIYTTIYEILGYDPLPKYWEPSVSPQTAPILMKNYPLILITLNRHLPYYHSEYYMISYFRKKVPYPVVEIHPNTARELGISDGDWVWIETRKGRCKMRARLSWGMHPRFALAQHCWWYPEQPAAEPSLHGAFDSNINVCTEDDPELCDPAFGSWPYSPLLCKIYKVKEE